ncbi:MAG: hypothetical protein JXB24_09995, partial [Bacteroidales bacterium]|nr:hypothetical protein [Bacteroidales bacterium]
MKHESVYIKIFLVSSRLKIFPALLILYTAAHSQQNPDTNTIKKIDYNLSVSSPDRSHLVYPSSAANKKMTLFLDSLKIKSSKSFITKKIYDYIVISPDARLSKNITSTSDINYLEHSGKRIRNIKINRLNVFGSDINYPAYEDPNKIEKLLNKTHINTNEKIIRKNLLFSEGDTISPLELSDNERIIRQLPFIDDARIIVFPVSENEADILILTKDVYSLGAELSFSGIKKGYLSAFDRNIFGMGHEFGIEIPYDSQFGDSPGFGIRYLINN